MKIVPTNIDGAAVLVSERIDDERGFFMRAFCKQTLDDAGIKFDTIQCNVSQNRVMGTLRGMHWQADPAPEPKIVHCVRGALYDVALDMRPASPTYLTWAAVELAADEPRAFYLAPGLAHGFMTIADDTEVFYQMGAAYVADLQRGVRWNDPAFSIDWPMEPAAISDRDASFPDFTVVT